MCVDTSIYSNNIYILNETTTIKEPVGTTGTIFINRDINGYYVKFNYPEKTNVVISISNLLGQKVNEDIKVEETQCEKYFDTSSCENQVSILSAV